MLLNCWHLSLTLELGIREWQADAGLAAAVEDRRRLGEGARLSARGL